MATVPVRECRMPTVTVSSVTARPVVLTPSAMAVPDEMIRKAIKRHVVINA
jgi:hypothetical protein